MKSIALALALASCAYPVADIDVDDDDEPAACPVVLVCDEETYGTQTRASGANACLECVATTVPEVPYAWTQVAPCAIP